MRIFAHVNHVLRGYTHLTHEAVVFQVDRVSEVSEEIAIHLTGAHPYEFCRLGESETAAQHMARCPFSGRGNYPTTEMEAPPVDRQMIPRRRGRPPLVRR